MPNEIGIFIRTSKAHKRTDQANNQQVVSRCTDGRYEDILTPSQYYDDKNEVSAWALVFHKYHALWSACLFDAYKLLKEGTSNERRIETFWFKSKSNRIGSFLWICRHLNLDSTAIREEVLR